MLLVGHVNFLTDIHSDDYIVIAMVGLLFSLPILSALCFAFKV